MLDNWKILGQVIPVAATDTLLYVVANSRQTKVETITVCNQDSGATTFQVRTSKAGEVSDLKQYLHFDTALAGNTTFNVECPIRLSPLDSLYVQSASGQVSFTAYGVEQFRD